MHLSTSIQFRRAGLQGLTRTRTAAVKRSIKQLQVLQYFNAALVSLIQPRITQLK